MTLREFNNLSTQSIYSTLEMCCVSSKWINRMIESKPFKSANELILKSSEIWEKDVLKEDVLEAFTGHPKIGDIESLMDKYQSSKEWAGKEQASVSKASVEIIQDLAKYNKLYEEKFGFIFIVSASGKTAEEMLNLIKVRVEHSLNTELNVAKNEQHKITTIRLAKLIDELPDAADMSSHITTHVLDTSTGIPGKNILIKLKENIENSWQTIALGFTNSDGRIANLLPPGRRLEPKNYLMEFDTNAYYQQNNQVGFYPKVDIEFIIVDKSHYHIPLLLNPYGYTTYRGS